MGDGELSDHERTALEDGRQQRSRGGEEQYAVAWYGWERDLPSGGVTPGSVNHPSRSVAFHEAHASVERSADNGIDALLSGWKR